MAKVYDALKRLESERSRIKAEPVALSRMVDAGAHAKTRPSRVWQRWSSGWGKRRNGQGVARDPHPAVLGRMEDLLARIETLEKSTPTDLPAIEERLAQIIDARLRAFEDEFEARLCEIADRQTRRVTQLNTRVTIILGVLIFTVLVAVLGL
jgi:hypothetical protein